MNDLRTRFVDSALLAWTNVLTFVPKLILFLAIAVVGYFIAKWIGKILDAILEKVGFDRLVERGGIKAALARTPYDASDLLAKVVFYSVFLFILDLAFSVFGPNPISDLLTRLIAFLPNVFVAILIVIVASAVARAVKDIVSATLAGTSYGGMASKLASAAILLIGLFAALSQLQIAPAIVNGLFYAGLTIIAGSAIIAIGGGGITPMRAQWEKTLGRISSAPRPAGTDGGSGEPAAWKKPVETNRPAYSSNPAP